jgi:hypothetical protein
MRLEERLIEVEDMCWKGMKERMGKMVGKGGEGGESAQKVQKY